MLIHSNNRNKINDVEESRVKKIGSRKTELNSVIIKSNTVVVG